MRLLYIFLMSALFKVAVSAQSPQPTDPAEAAAEKAYTSQDWSHAETQYLALTGQHPANAHFWYRLGVSARGAKHYNLSLDAMQKAKAEGAGKGLQGFVADYEIATTYAAMGDKTRALEILKAAADGGYFQPSRIQNDAEWNSLRTNEKFIALAREAQHNASPCEDAEFKQFDFWLGDWDVASAGDGVHRGSSHVSKEMGGCVVWENWTSAGSPYFGKSYNTWNANLKRWEQYWVDNSAGAIFFHGSIEDGAMDYWTDDVPQPGGGTLRRHLQFFPIGPDKVRQFSQGSTDAGKTWHVEYDLIYTRTSSARNQ